MRRLQVVVLLCCVLALDAIGAKHLVHSCGLAFGVRATTTMGHLHVELRETPKGALHVRVGYGESNGREYDAMVLLTLRSGDKKLYELVPASIRLSV